MAGGLAYRADIDGLRCVSVLAVFAYHYGSRKFSGGFVGVDVFFVISGFVITSQLYRELEGGSFSLLSFYDRRIRRILPATLVVILATVFAGLFLLPPIDYVRLGYSALSAAIGTSNFYFYDQAGYFGPAQRSLPLLNTWSLGVEEQFYLIWPLLLVLIAKASRLSKHAISSVLVAIIICSFAASVSIVRADQPQAFYMLYTRAWELALGAVLVFLPAITSRLCAEVLAAVGVALIAYSIFSLSGNSLFPGVNALWPCVGAALIVMPKQHETLVARVLSLSPMVFIGAISFSLYLWHWPVYVLYSFYDLRSSFPPATTLALVALSFAFAILSYYFIEQPIRRLRPRRAWTLACGATASATLCGLGATIVAAEGYPTRFSPASLKYYAYARSGISESGYESCFLTSQRDDVNVFNAEQCIQISSTKPNVLIIGDSHAAQFARALRQEFPDISFSQVTASGCMPALPLRGAPRCTLLMERVVNEITVKNTFDDIVISGRWKKDAVWKLTAMVHALSNRARHITVLGPNVEYSAPLPLLLGKSIDLADADIIIDRASNANAIKIESTKVQRNLIGTSAQFLSVVDAQCAGDGCKTVTSDGAPMLSDDNHFSFEGATEILRSLKKRGLFSWRTQALQEASSNEPQSWQ